MRITAINTQQPNFRAIRVTKAAEDIVKFYRKDSAEFHDAFQELALISDEFEDDILIQASKSGVALNFQAVDPYTEIVNCYLSVDEDPIAAIKKAMKNYIKYSKQPRPPKESVADSKEVKPAENPKKSILRRLIELL